MSAADIGEVLTQSIRQQQETLEKLQHLLKKHQSQTRPASAALLIGINYENRSLTGKGVSQLRGCINDVHRVRDFLQGRLGFDAEHVTVVTDYPKDGGPPPTGRGILKRIDTFIADAKRRNCKRLWFHFSGHGAYQVDYNGDEVDGRDECLIGSDGRGVTDDTLLKRMILQAPKDAMFTCVADCCHSATQLDLRYRYIGGKRSVFMNRDFLPDQTVCRTLCLSGCRDSGTSADAYLNKEWAGALTSLMLEVLDESGIKITCQELLRKVRAKLRAQSFAQVPQLTTTHKITNETKFCC